MAEYALVLLFDFIHSYCTVCHLICLLRERDWLKDRFCELSLCTSKDPISYSLSFNRDSLTNETNKQTSCTKLITSFELICCLTLWNCCVFFFFGWWVHRVARRQQPQYTKQYEEKKITPNAEFAIITM